LTKFAPHLDVLLPPQKRLWAELVEIPAEFVLYGDTAVALRFGHRTSVDFDFFACHPLDADRLLSELRLLSECDVMQRAPNTLTVSVMRDGPIKLSFFGGITFGRVGVPEQTDDSVVTVASSLDLLATKLKVLLERTQAKDYHDIECLLRGGLSLKEGLGAAISLYGAQFPPADCVKALTYFKGGDLETLPEDVMQFLIQAASRWDVGVAEVPVLSRDLNL
jgi:hypothetical protein